MEDRKKAYDIQYIKDHIKQISLPLNRSTDADIIQHLESIPNKAKYLKDLIRKAMQERG